VFVINDVRKDDLDQVSSAYKNLFHAAGGGAIGLFTAISRLRAVYDKIKAPLNDENIHLYGQHMDDMDAGTLVDIFRDDTHACLLGTDAIRDGVDVPGDSLRLIVFDRVPWPRPTIMHKARREAFGKKRYDDMLTRLKLKQAYGRLIRRADDKGVFVMLDSMMPSRLQGAFPEGVEIERIGLSEALTQIEDFLS
jgi:ATP-dependent DNA helicase DinG